MMHNTPTGERWDTKTNKWVKTYDEGFGVMGFSERLPSYKPEMAKSEEPKKESKGNLGIYKNLLDVLWEHTDNTTTWRKSCGRRLIAGLTPTEVCELFEHMNLTYVAGKGSIVEQILNVLNDSEFKDLPIMAQLDKMGVSSYVATQYHGHYCD